VKLSVIIPALNEAANFRRAVESAWQAGANEVLVSDGGSTDETPQIAGSLDCKLIASARGRALQQNEAARLAHGDVLLFLHADCALASGVANQIERTLAKPQVLHGAFRQRIEAQGVGFRLLERGNAARVRLLGLPYGDQAIFVRRSLFEKLGGFPEVPLLEDLILMQRLRQRAWPALLPGPVFVNPRRWQSRGIVRQTLRNWRIVSAYSLGVPPDQLAGQYPAHSDQS
jgi:rSAM/selenodomain-associated transferase 2